jgi:hypothetical protein
MISKAVGSFVQKDENGLFAQFISDFSLKD